MATVRKLSIQGVRSFSPDEKKRQWIEFDSPLTLILGVNGSGKTTIIESLKFAITNQFPPNSCKGASFVNDPKLTLSESSLAKITLEVGDLKGNKYTTSRKVKTTVKNNKGELSMQQLEALLRTVTASGKSTELNNKCGDIKSEMCRIMGVSEAILNHVIFCHQEESCWPLDEAKKVKETFDAIFNTWAYKKCFDRLNNKDKDLTTKIKVEEEGLKFVKDNRQRAIRYRGDLDDLKIQSQQQNDQVKEYESEIEVLEKKLKEFQALEAEFANKQSEVAERKTKIDEIGKQISELRGHIKEEYPGSISELKDSIKEFGNECIEKQNEIKRCEKDYKLKDNEWTKLGQEKSKLIKEEGMFQQEENANKKRVTELNALLTEIVAGMKSLDSSGVGSDAFSEAFTSNLTACDNRDDGELSYDVVAKTLNSALRMKESELQKIRADFLKEEENLQAIVDEARAKMASTEKEKDMKRQQQTECKRSQDETKKRLKALEGSDDALRLLEDDEERCLKEIEDIEKSDFMQKCDEEIKSLTKEVKKLEGEVSTVSNTINILVADKSKTDQIDLLTRQKKQKDADCKKIMGEMQDDLSEVLETVPDEGVGKAIESKTKSLASEIQEQKIKLKANEKALTESKSDLKSTDQELNKLEKKFKAGKAKIASLLEDRQYDEVYEEVTASLNSKQSDSYYSESASFLYKKYVTKLNKKDCCPLCKRDFEAKRQVKQLITEIENDIKRMQQNLPTLKQEVDELKERQIKLLDSKPTWDECHEIETEMLPTLKTKKMELNEKIENLSEVNEAVTSTLTALENDLQIVSSCKSKVAVYEQCKKEVKGYENQIVKLERTRKEEAKELDMSLDNAQTQLQELQGLMENKRAEKENKEDIRNRKRNNLAKLSESKNKFKEEKLKITAELQNREALENKRKELEETAKTLQAEIVELGHAVPVLKSDISKAEKNKNSCVQRKEEALKKVREEKEGLDRKKIAISDSNKLILQFEKRKGKGAALRQQVIDCEQTIAECEGQKKEIALKIQSLKNDVASQEVKQRDLKDNLSLKLKLEDVSKLKVELKEKEKLLSQAENRGAATERREVSQKHQTITKKLSEMKGQLIEVRRRIRELEKELAHADLATAEQQYIEKFARKSACHKAQNDIKKYKTALDEAIMQFHHKKMEKINKILHDYWKKIYKGNDIDKIMIKTEAEKDKDEKDSKTKKVASGASTRRNYKYRVVMVRQGVEIDMRGRCSAGQRVLASIIIRIALAESFGSRCGIITLDEPTTNLDQKNINALAETLANLAEKMTNRKNFQLIVITHDKEFTQRLSGVDTVDKYWRVDRDNEGFSRITMVVKRGE